VLDIDLPGNLGGIELIRVVHHNSPHTHFVILTNSVEPVAIHETLRAGALGYLLKTVSIDELAQAIRAAHHGLPALSPQVTQVLIGQASPSREHLLRLTARERDVLDLMARGLNNQQIAAELHISLSTVQFHVSNILDKLDVHNRTEAATFALRHHLASGNA
jgi:DNA-binding NarL/FixJ family response regulator